MKQKPIILVTSEKVSPGGKPIMIGKAFRTDKMWLADQEFDKRVELIRRSLDEGDSYCVEIQEGVVDEHGKFQDQGLPTRSRIIAV